MAVDVQLPDGRRITVNTDDPKAAALAARKFLEKERTAAALDTLGRGPDIPATMQGAAAPAPAGQVGNPVSRALGGVAGGLENVAASRVVPDQSAGLDPSDIPDAAARTLSGLGGGAARLGEGLTSRPLETLKDAAVGAGQTATSIVPKLRQIGPELAAGRPGQAGRSALDATQAAAETALLLTPAGRLKTTGTPVAGRAGEVGVTGKGAESIGLRTRERAPKPSEAPSLQALEREADELFRAAERNGVTASGEQTKGLQKQIDDLFEDQAVVTPSGKVDSTLPKVAAAKDLIDEFAGKEMTVKQMQRIRRRLRRAAGSADPDERRIGIAVRDAFDDFTAPLAPELARAREVFQRVKKGEQLTQLRDLAGVRAGQFTGSGFENALRTEFRGLDRKITKGQERGFSQAEKAAIRRVARGAPISNMARFVGRSAPTGPVTQGTTIGLPFLAGSSIGGPGVGAAFSAGATAIGFGGRALATKLGLKNADTAEALVRAGVPRSVVTKMNDIDREQMAAAIVAVAAENEASNPQERP